MGQSNMGTSSGTPGSTSANTGTGTTGTGAAGTTATTSTRSMPARTETSDSALRKLDSTNKGYVSQQDVKDLTGFDFTIADANHDGRLSQEEFRKAWSNYSTNR